MKDLRSIRKISGMSQIDLGRRAGVSRMRLQLAEAGQVALRPEEANALEQVLVATMQHRAASLVRALTGKSDDSVTAVESTRQTAEAV